MTEQEWLATDDPMAIYRLIEMARVPGIATHQVATERGLVEVPKVQVSDRKLRLWLAACIDLSEYDYFRMDSVYLRSGVACWREGLPEMIVDPSTGQMWERYPLQDEIRPWCNSAADNEGDPSTALRCDLLRDIIGNPWQPVPLNPQHITPQVVSLAQAAWDDRPDDRPTLDPLRLTMLADALEEAGCCGAMDYCAAVELGGCGGLGWVHAPDPWQLESRHPKWREVYPGDRRGQIPCPRCDGTGRVRQSSLLLDHLRSPTPHIRGCWALDLVLGCDGEE